MNTAQPPRPSAKQVSEYLETWKSLEPYAPQESSLKKLFFETYPKNVDMNDVLIKVCSLNVFYSTRIRKPFIVAKHIVDLDIDQRLLNKDIALVDDIARVKINEQKTINFYSFATKYCSHHFPEDYPIYDSFVDEMLWHFKKKDEFFEFKRKDLRHYPTYYAVLTEFRKFYELERFNLKEIDKYLWQAGKKYFP